mmetsp:Transcript_28744/g.64909  ORF Transcript_28744/g.64909 Transcript_28744/m.64909 type:complete len:205 (+) Transcript_28744:981-1595(+)
MMPLPLARMRCIGPTSERSSHSLRPPSKRSSSSSCGRPLTRTATAASRARSSVVRSHLLLPCHRRRNRRRKRRRSSRAQAPRTSPMRSWQPSPRSSRCAQAMRPVEVTRSFGPSAGSCSASIGTRPATSTEMTLRRRCALTAPASQRAHLLHSGVISAAAPAAMGQRSMWMFWRSGCCALGGARKASPPRPWRLAPGRRRSPGT